MILVQILCHWRRWNLLRYILLESSMLIWEHRKEIEETKKKCCWDLYFAFSKTHLWIEERCDHVVDQMMPELFITVAIGLCYAHIILDSKTQDEEMSETPSNSVPIFTRIARKEIKVDLIYEDDQVCHRISNSQNPIFPTDCLIVSCFSWCSQASTRSFFGDSKRTYCAIICMYGRSPESKRVSWWTKDKTQKMNNIFVVAGASRVHCCSNRERSRNKRWWLSDYREQWKKCWSNGLPSPYSCFRWTPNGWTYSIAVERQWLVS